MDDELQRMVDALALTIEHSVAVDDAQLRLLRSSAHFGDEDDLRLKSLVDRRVPDDVAAHLHRLGVPSWREPGHVAGTDEVPFATRWCVPLRTRFELLGFLWVIDDGDLAEAQLGHIREAAAGFEMYLGRDAERRHEADRRREELVRAVVRGEVAQREAGIDRLRDGGSDLAELLQAPAATVIVISLASRPPDPGLDLGPEAFLSRGLRAGLATRPPGSYAVSIDADEAIAVVGWSTAPASVDVETVAFRIRDSLTRTEPAFAEATVIGVGGQLADLGAAHLSYRQARLAVDVARAEGVLLRLWSGLGAAGFVSAAAPSAVDPALVPEPFASLLEQQGDETLDLIQAFLDNGGSAAVTATQLNLHRSTLYYRVGRFEQGTGLSLDRGGDRLAVHLWLALRQRH